MQFRGRRGGNAFLESYSGIHQESGVRKSAETKRSVGEPAEGSLLPFIQLVRPRTHYVINIHTNIKKKIFNGGYLGSHNEEERSELR